MMTWEQEKDLAESHLNNQAFSLHLKKKTDNLILYEQQKNKKMMRRQVERLIEIRGKSHYSKDM